MKQEELKKEYKGFDKIIVDYVNEKIDNDKDFEKDVLKEVKTVTRCVEYVRKNAKKQADNNVACINDSQVYDWINEYFTTDLAEIQPKEEDKPAMVDKPKTEYKPKKKAKANIQQMSLFE